MNEQNYQTVQREITMRFYRSCPVVNKVEIKRNGLSRKYEVSESRITELQRLVRKHRIEIEVEFMYYTEITFTFDKE